MVVRCGQIGLVGRPNVGKSTLLNCLLGSKVSITSRKPQTTRLRTLGILTENDCQYVFVDTPGFNKSRRKRLSQCMYSALKSTLMDVDVVVWVVDAMNWNEVDESFARSLPSSPLIVAVNKIDLAKKPNCFLKAEIEEKVRSVADPASLCWVSARQKQGTDVLLSDVCSLLPQQEFMYPEDMLTDKSEIFLISEVIREKVFRCLGDELPYGSAVLVESFEDCDNVVKIRALIYVEKERYRRIIIGKNGSLIKTIGIVARQDIENFLGRKVFLSLWVKVKLGWCDDVPCLQKLGHEVIDLGEGCPKELS
ncbi:MULTISPECIES: GTPase Era [Candidatus Ichthyocystis]|uniref:GTPase Era n=1 Tax=Candidatus Ichthyocystis TaxID=2929841 RepID=UPI000A6E6ACB|nr:MULTISPECIES: GTPase Era [Ichthyocystis]